MIKGALSEFEKKKLILGDEQQLTSMPPRKVDGSSQKPVERKPRGRVKKVKPVLKTPSIVKVKIKIPSDTTNDRNIENDVNKDVVKEVKKPNTNKKTIIKRQRGVKKNISGEPATKEVAPVKKKGRRTVSCKNGSTVKPIGDIKTEDTKFDITKLNANYFKILLANEVVNSQFAKKPKHIDNDPVEQMLQENKLIAKRKSVSNGKAGLKNKVTNRKKQETIVPVRSKRLGRPKKIRNIQKEEEKLTEEESKEFKTSNIKPVEQNKPANKQKRIIKPTYKVAMAGPKSRTKVNDVTNEKKVKSSNETDTMENGTHIDLNKCVDTRRASGDRSNKSWTRDISSSSNSSLVTVLSKDFYYFDNKIPILQLNNIDKELLLKNNKQCIIDNCFEDSKSVVDNYRVIKDTKDTAKDTKDTADDNQQFPNLGFKRSTSRPCSDTTKFGFLTHSRTENCSDVDNKMNNSTLSVSTSSTSSSSSSSSCSSSSSSNSSMASSNIIMQKALDNRLSTEKVVDNTNEQHSVSSVDRTLKTTTNTETVLQKLNSNINKFDITKIKWSQNKNVEINSSNMKNIQDKIFGENLFKDESDLCCLCQAIMQLEIDEADICFNNNEFLESTRISRPKSPETINSQNNHIINEKQGMTKHVDCNNENVETYIISPQVQTNELVEKTAENGLPCNKPNYSSFTDNDDDDALSLYAESLTEIESCKKNSIFKSESYQFEEYIPQPVVAPLKTLISYQPTKIVNNLEHTTTNSASECEKEKADNSFVSSKNLELRENTLIYEDRLGNISQYPSSLSNVTKNTLGSNTSRLMALIHKPAHGRKSLVFKGCCYFNLKTTCQKRNCTFPHIYLNINDVKNSLKMLSEESFIQEYILMRKWPKLRRRYGQCFVEEAMRRELTRIVVEMAIDFIVRMSINSTEDNALKSEVVDNVLMYLNHIDLSTCDDLLGYNLKLAGNLLLCDYFMSVIATSQNFSRFKSVFINLTDFMHKNGRTFNAEVAESILERLCILPYDEALARSLLHILENTDVAVFSNTRISDLERQLLTSNCGLYHELKLLKEQALVNQPVLGTYKSINEPPVNIDVDSHNPNYGHKNKNIIRQMPNLSNANELPIATKFTMTIDLKKLKESGFSVSANTNSIEQGVNNPFMNEERHNVVAISKSTDSNKQQSIGSIVNNSSKQWTKSSSLEICENASANSKESINPVVNNQLDNWMTPNKLQGGEIAATSNNSMKPRVNFPIKKWSRPGITETDEATTSRGMQDCAKKPFHNWKNRNFDNFCNRTPIASFPSRPPRASFKRHSERGYEGSAPKYNRGQNMTSWCEDTRDSL